MWPVPPCFDIMAALPVLVRSKPLQLAQPLKRCTTCIMVLLLLPCVLDLAVVVGVAADAVGAGFVAAVVVTCVVVAAAVVAEVVAASVVTALLLLL